MTIFEQVNQLIDLQKNAIAKVERLVGPHAEREFEKVVIAFEIEQLESKLDICLGEAGYFNLLLDELLEAIGSYSDERDEPMSTEEYEEVVRHGVKNSFGGPYIER